MPDFKAIYDKLDEIPESVENFRELFTEKNGKFELTGFKGVKTEADVARLNAALEKERNEHKGAKDRLGIWGDLSYEDVQAKLDRIPELEAAAEGKLDDAKIDELATKRADGVLRTKLAPLERDLRKVSTERETLLQEVVQLRQRETFRRLEDELRPMLVEAKVYPEFHEDALLYARQHLAPSEDGAGFFVKDGIDGFTSGNVPKDWLTELLEKRPRWRPESVGGGARGSESHGFTGSNPWKPDSWNVTEQGKVLRDRGMDIAKRMAQQAGTKVGGTRPRAKSS